MKCSQPPYRTGNHTHILGVLLEPVVHILTNSKQVVKTRGLPGRPIAFRNLQINEKDNYERKKLERRRLKREYNIQMNKDLDNHG